MNDSNLWARRRKVIVRKNKYEIRHYHKFVSKNTIDFATNKVDAKIICKAIDMNTYKYEGNSSIYMDGKRIAYRSWYNKNLTWVNK